MKNFKCLCLLASLLMLCFSCSKDDSSSGCDIDVEKIVGGEWIYDHPELGVWEAMKFFESGAFYYSNIVDTWKINNKNNDGRYSIDKANGQISGTYSLKGVAMNLNMKVLSISKFSFTALWTDSGKTFTYSKLLNTIRIKPGDSIHPEYAQFVSANITGFNSHKSQIATVDGKTGEIHAVKSGHTYIDVITEEGTAVIEIISFDEMDMFDDYSFALTKTISEIVNIVGDNYLYRNDYNGVTYLSDDYVIDTVKYITGSDISRVEYVLVNINSNVTKEQILRALKNKFTLIQEDNEIHSYKTDENIEETAVSVVYNESNSTICWAQLKPTEKLPILTCLFGANKDVVREAMNGRNYQFLQSFDNYSFNGSDAYSINGYEWANAVEFVFNTDNVVSEYYIYLNWISEEELQLCNDYLVEKEYSEDKGEYVEGYGIIYYNPSKTQKVVLNVSYPYIQFVDLTQKKIEHVLLGNYWKGLGMSKDELFAVFGNPYMDYVDEGRMLYMVIKDYIGSVNYYLDSNKEKVSLINMFLRSDVSSDIVSNYLDNLYNFYDSGINDNGQIYRWINADTREEADMMISFFPDYKVVVYQHPSSAGPKYSN